MYRWLSLYADFLSAISRIFDWNYGISEERILQFTDAIGLIICKFIYASQFFRSLSIAYNEDRLYLITGIEQSFWQDPLNFRYFNKRDPKFSIWYAKKWCKIKYRFIDVNLNIEMKRKIWFVITWNLWLKSATGFVGSLDLPDTKIMNKTLSSSLISSRMSHNQTTVTWLGSKSLKWKWFKSLTKMTLNETI